MLVIEDNMKLADNIVDYLSSCGHILDTAADGPGGLSLASSNSYDVIVLDLGLPGLDGISVCRRLREDGVSTPVIMLTAKGELEDRVNGLDSGAEDYLVKPVALAELDARIRAQHRRSRGGVQRKRLQVAHLELDEDTHEVTLAGQKIAMTRMDFAILRVLMRESPRTVTMGQLEEEVWEGSLPVSDSIRTHIYRLRRALDHSSRQSMIRTIHGVGYRLVPIDAVSK
ncbi:MAG: response regulator transcription factor [Halioglobus sp.]